MGAAARAAGRRRRGFTLIELMVVVAIVVMAMGIMTPTLIEFFNNQKLKNTRAHFVSAFNVARLMAIIDGTPVRVVFFKEGVRVYNVRHRAFRREEEFVPEAAPGSITGITFEVRFAGRRNEELTPYRQWEKDQPDLFAAPGTPGAGECSVEKQVALEFQRDGTINWMVGSDVPSILFNKTPPQDADLVVRQEGNRDVLFIDLRPTGQVRSLLYDMKSEPAAAEANEGRSKR